MGLLIGLLVIVPWLGRYTIPVNSRVSIEVLNQYLSIGTGKLINRLTKVMESLVLGVGGIGTVIVDTREQVLRFLG